MTSLDRVPDAVLDTLRRRMTIAVERTEQLAERRGGWWVAGPRGTESAHEKRERFQALLDEIITEQARREEGDGP